MKKNKLKSVIGATLLASALATSNASQLPSTVKSTKGKKLSSLAIKDSSDDIKTMRDGSKTEQGN